MFAYDHITAKIYSFPDPFFTRFVLGSRAAFAEHKSLNTNEAERAMPRGDQPLQSSRTKSVDTFTAVHGVSMPRICRARNAAGREEAHWSLDARHRTPSFSYRSFFLLASSSHASASMMKVSDLDPCTSLRNHVPAVRAMPPDPAAQKMN